MTLIAFLTFQKLDSLTIAFPELLQISLNGTTQCSIEYVGRRLRDRERHIFQSRDQFFSGGVTISICQSLDFLLKEFKYVGLVHRFDRNDIALFHKLYCNVPVAGGYKNASVLRLRKKTRWWFATLILGFRLLANTSRLGEDLSIISVIKDD